MRIYLSGRFTTNYKIEKAWLKRSGCKYRCFSFAFLNEEKPVPGYYNKKVVAALKAVEDAKVAIMMDSGAFSLHALDIKKKKVKDFNIYDVQNKVFEAYVKYCTANASKWAFYVTLDFKINQPLIYEMQQRFLSRGLAPMPVFHGDQSVDWLLKHKDMGHDYICVGGLHLHKGRHGVDFYLDKVFNFGAKHGLRFHGLAMTSMKQITTWPFYSVDSSTWSQTAAYGMILLPDTRRVKFLNVHVSSKRSGNPNTHHSMSDAQKGKLKELIAFHGFDFKTMHDNEDERHDWNGYVMSNLDKFGVVQQNRRTWENLI